MTPKERMLTALSGGTPDRLPATSEVEHLFSTFGRNGGYVMSASDHFFHVPRENLLHYAKIARSCVY